MRRILPRCWFNEATTEAGRGALAADAFGLMAIYYEEPEHSSLFNRDMSEHSRKERFLYARNKASGRDD